MELRHLTLSRLSAARGRTHLFADQAAVAARMVPLSSIVASDVADTLTRLLLRGGMLAEPALPGVPVLGPLSVATWEAALPKPLGFSGWPFSFGSQPSQP